MDGGIITTHRLSFSFQTHPPSIFTLHSLVTSLGSLTRYTRHTHSRDFSRSLLRRSSPTAGDLGFFIMLSLCSHYALVMLWLGAEPPRWSIERSSRRLGAEPHH